MPSDFPALPSYQQQRERFLIAANAANAHLIEYPHPLPGPFGELLATDVAIVGDPAAARRLFVLSGTHGIEGYYGSDNQIQALQHWATTPLPAGLAIVMVHLINPWGTAWMRRVNEHNIDLNRNYVDFSAALPDNVAYADLHHIYSCTHLAGPARQAADAALATQVERHGWSQVMGIVEAGQYRLPDGLFFGGVEPSWSNQTLRRILALHLSGAEEVIGFDLHTGAGEYGHPMLLTVAEQAYAALPQAKALFGPWLYTVLTGANRQSATGIAATATGYTSQAMLEALPDVHLMQLVMECGTYPGEQVHTVLRDDQWLHLHGDPLDRTGRQIKLHLLEQFYPRDPDWRQLTALRTWQVFQRALGHLAGQRPSAEAR